MQKLFKGISSWWYYFILQKRLKNYISGVNLNYDDAIVIYLNNKTTLCGIYIPPNDSDYSKDQFKFLDSLTKDAHENDEKLIIFGDLNSRIGVVDHFNEFEYSENCDKTLNQNGRRLLEFITEHTMMPLNDLNTEEHRYEGNFTFHRGEVQSQIDWFLVDESSLNLVIYFNIMNMFENISDHLPVSACINVDLGKPIETILASITDLSTRRNNHSKTKRINPDEIDENEYVRTATCLINNSPNYWNSNGRKTIDEIEYIIVNAAKCSSVKKILSKNDENDWIKIMNDGNSKRMWTKIDWQGNLSYETPTSENNIEDYAEFLKERCTLPEEHSNFSDLKADIYNPIADLKIKEEEVHSSIKDMKSKGQASIPIISIILTLSQIINMLTIALNSVFLGKYPKDWNPVMKCLPTKGKQNIPNFRGLGIKTVFAKIYDAILMRRLEKCIKTPEEQTAYQKNKGCFMHVFFC